MSSRHVRAHLATGIGIVVPEDVQVTLTKTQSSDTMRATFPLRTNFPDYWASEAPLPVGVIIMGKELFKGEVDNVEFDYTGGKISISGRDKSAGMIETNSNESFRNQSRADIVRQIAGRHGLTAQITGGADMAGLQYDQNEHAHLTDNVSDWTTVQRLAELDGVTSFVTGDILFYGPSVDAAVKTVVIYHVPQTPFSHQQGNWTDLKFTRNVRLGQNVRVRVNSWHPRRRQAVTAERNLPGAGGTLNYTYRHSQLEQGQADGIAERRLRENSKNELQCTANIPGDVSISVRGKISVRGTACDQDYEVSQLSHHVTQGGGEGGGSSHKPGAGGAHGGGGAGHGGFRTTIASKEASAKRGGGGARRAGQRAPSRAPAGAE